VLKSSHATKLVAAGLLLSGALTVAADAQEKPRFSVKDDVEIAQFGDVFFWIRGDVLVSPSGDKVLVHTVRTLLADGAMHDELRVYATSQLRDFVNAPGVLQQVEPIWTIEESRAGVGGDGPLISAMRWFDDENGIAFLLRTDAYHRRLYMAKLDSHDATELTPAQDDVLAFSIRNESHYAFAVASRETRERALRAVEGLFQVGTGVSFWDLNSPEQRAQHIDRGDLWAANGGPPTMVKDPTTGKPLALYEAGTQSLAMSPDGSMLVTVRAENSIPKEWESQYPPSYAGSAIRIRAGIQDLEAADGLRYVGEYVLITLKSGAITSLVKAPTSAEAGWSEAGPALPAWADDGRSVLLPGTFLPKTHGADGRPCVAVVRVETGVSECVKPLERDQPNGFDSGYARTDTVMFAPGKSDEVLLKYSSHTTVGATAKTYARSGEGTWAVKEHESGEAGASGLEVKVTADFKTPPALVATDTLTGKSRIVFDPNPQLKNLRFGEPELRNWEDRIGRKWEGILFKPVGFQPGKKYPLVIQNHGFSMDRFAPSGGFPSAFVAQELASAGIMVLQMRDCAGRATLIEGPCNVEGYESAVEKLSGEGLVDPAEVGIIGFSRTVFYVLEALTTSRMHFRAASITDGINLGYPEYVFSMGPSDAYKTESEAMIGASPVGPGLLDWIKRAPLFNMDRVSTPLRVVATRNGSLIGMWEPYALLQAMHKPVDLVVLNTEEHVITDPRVRMEAQNGNVDWFRFWLQGYEDPDPAKTTQYERWRRLRGLQATP
jgi:hypothetical protein